MFPIKVRLGADCRRSRPCECRPFPRLHIPDVKPVRLDETLAEPGCHCHRPLFSDVADVRRLALSGAACSSSFDATAISPSLTVAGALRHSVIPSLPMM